MIEVLDVKMSLGGLQLASDTALVLGILLWLLSLFLLTPIGMSLITKKVSSLPELPVTPSPQSESSTHLTQRSDGTKMWYVTANLAISFSATVDILATHLSIISMINGIREILTQLDFALGLVSLAIRVTRRLISRNSSSRPLPLSISRLLTSPMTLRH
jgi:hypothetical protein